ncbi:MAG: hypothetical protein WBW80_08365, partial [Acidimicrobiales bacterium]
YRPVHPGFRRPALIAVATADGLTSWYSDHPALPSRCATTVRDWWPVHVTDTAVPGQTTAGAEEWV